MNIESNEREVITENQDLQEVTKKFKSWVRNKPEEIWSYSSKQQNCKGSQNPADTKVEIHRNTKQHITLIYNRLNFVLNE